MTSLERQGECTYGAATSPAYGVLTYTWGRYRTTIKGAPALRVKGVTWEIPAIKETHFTVQAFQNVIDRIGEHYDYAWIDIACIDQENRIVKMEEVGRQAAIFRRAGQAFAWLNLHNHATTQEILDGILDLDHDMACWKLDVLSKHNVGREEELLSRLDKVLKPIRNLSLDPWFSSLWALQESVLRRDAMVLSTSGLPLSLCHSRDSNIHLDILSNHLANTWQDLVRYADAWPESVKPVAEEIQLTLETTGFFFSWTNNPNLQYGLARHRITKHPLDRIYGIMQIYGFRLGESAHPGAGVSMLDLELELGKTLIKQSAILSQWFVHTEEPRPGLSWLITQNSQVPDNLWIYPDTTEKDKTQVSTTAEIIITERNTAKFISESCSLHVLVEGCKRSRPGHNHQYFAFDKLSYIFPDDFEYAEQESQMFNHPAYWKMPFACSLLTYPFSEEEVRVVRLGHISKDFWGPMIEIHGVIVLKRPSGVWVRVGVASWTSSDGTIEDEYPRMSPFVDEVM